MDYGHKQCNVVNTIYNFCEHVILKLRGKWLCYRHKLLDRYEKIVCEWWLGEGVGVVVLWRGILQSYYPKTGYPGTRSITRRVPGYKNTRKSEHLFCCEIDLKLIKSNFVVLLLVYRKNDVERCSPATGPADTRMEHKPAGSFRS